LIEKREHFPGVQARGGDRRAEIDVDPGALAQGPLDRAEFQLALGERRENFECLACGDGERRAERDEHDERRERHERAGGWSRADPGGEPSL
jgi:hypothetical protein